MRRNYIVRLFALLTMWSTFACNGREVHSDAESGGHQEEALSGAVKGLTASVDEKIVASSPFVYADSGTRIFQTKWQGHISFDTRQQTRLSSRVAGRIERMHVRYNYEPVKKGQLIMEVYSPDLLAAQRELLFLAREGQQELQRSAVQKLLYLGMTREQINRVMSSGEPLYRVGVYSPVSGFIAEQQGQDGPVTNSQALALREGQYVSEGDAVLSIYKNESVVAEFALNAKQAVGIRAGQPVLFDSGGGRNVIRAKVSLLEPVIRAGESFSVARVYLPAGEFTVGELVEASVPVVVDRGWWLPESAIVDLGGESAVFVRNGNLYSPEYVEVGRNMEGYVQVLSDLKGRPVARDAAYLVDSESFINLRK